LVYEKEVTTNSKADGPGHYTGIGHRSYKTEGLVLRSVATMEADRLITLLTPTAGKIRAVVRGARRVKSRLGGQLDVMNRSSLGLVHGRTFDVVTGAQTIETFPKLKGDLDRIAQALYLMELADALIPEESPHPGAYRLLLDGLHHLNESGLNPAIPRYTELHLLKEAGYMPELQRCVACYSELVAAPIWYHPELGGVLCEPCGRQESRAFGLSITALKVLRFFGKSRLVDAIRLRLELPIDGELKSMLRVTLEHVLDRGSNTGNFLDHLRLLRSHKIHTESSSIHP